MSTAGWRRTISSPSAWATQPATAMVRSRPSARRAPPPPPPPRGATAPPHGDGEVAAFGATLGLGVAQAAQLGIDLLRGMLADVAGVQHDQVGLLGCVGHGIAERPQDGGQAVRIADVHLAPLSGDGYG